MRFDFYLCKATTEITDFIIRQDEFPINEITPLFNKYWKELEEPILVDTILYTTDKYHYNRLKEATEKPDDKVLFSKSEKELLTRISNYEFENNLSKLESTITKIHQNSKSLKIKYIEKSYWKTEKFIGLYVSDVFLKSIHINNDNDLFYDEKANNFIKKKTALEFLDSIVSTMDKDDFSLKIVNEIKIHLIESFIEGENVFC